MVHQKLLIKLKNNLLRIVPVHSVTNLDQEGSSVEAEVALSLYLYF